MSAFASDVGIVCFDGPGILRTRWDDVAPAVGSGVGDGGIGTSSNGFIDNSWPWVDGDDYLESLPDAITCCPRGRRDRVGDCLWLTRDVD